MIRMSAVFFSMTTNEADLPVSQIWALTVFPSTCTDLVANSTPMVDLESRLNSFLVKRESTAIETGHPRSISLRLGFVSPLGP